MGGGTGDGYNIFEPKNNIYLIKNKDGEVEKIIGHKEDKMAMIGLARLVLPKQISNSEIQNAIKRVCEANTKMNETNIQEIYETEFKPAYEKQDVKTMKNLLMEYPRLANNVTNEEVDFVYESLGGNVENIKKLIYRRKE